MGTQELLDEHTLTHSGEFTCYICEDLFTTQELMDEHMVTHSGEITPPMVECEVGVSDDIEEMEMGVSCNAQNAENSSSETDKKTFICSVCSKQLSTQHSLTQHLLS